MSCGQRVRSDAVVVPSVCSPPPLPNTHTVAVLRFVLYTHTHSHIPVLSILARRPVPTAAPRPGFAEWPGARQARSSGLPRPHGPPAASVPHAHSPPSSGPTAISTCAHKHKQTGTGGCVPSPCVPRRPARAPAARPAPSIPTRTKSAVRQSHLGVAHTCAVTVVCSWRTRASVAAAASSGASKGLEASRARSLGASSAGAGTTGTRRGGGGDPATAIAAAASRSSTCHSCSSP
jgi:hypothetical protein